MILVDGANVVGSRPDGWWRDRAGAAARLVVALAAAELGPCTVVLEGAARPGVAAGAVDGSASPGADPSEGLLVEHAPGSGDDTLVALCRPGVTLVSADRGLRVRAEAAGATCQGPRWLLDQLPPPSPP